MHFLWISMAPLMISKDSLRIFLDFLMEFSRISGVSYEFLGLFCLISVDLLHISMEISMDWLRFSKDFLMISVVFLRISMDFIGSPIDFLWR